MKKRTLLFIGFLALTTFLKAEEPTTFFKPNQGNQEKYLSNVKLLKKQKRGGDAENCVKLKTIPLLFRMFSVQYERALNEKMSIACDVNLLFFSASQTSGSLSDGKVTYSGFGLSPEFRFYPGEEALKGFFVGPYLSYLGMGIKVEGTNGNNGKKGTAELSGISAFGGGVLLGWKWIFADVFALETHLGVNYLNLTIPSTINIKYDDGTSETEVGPTFSASGVLPTVGLSLGYSF